VGAAAGIAGFLVSARQADRILEKGKGKTMFFLTGLAKLLVFAAMFFAVSRFAGTGIVFFIQGLLMIYLGAIGAGLRQAASGGGHGA
jgi:hypothetical protein